MIDVALWQERLAEYLLLRGYAQTTVITYGRAVGCFLEFLAEGGLTSLSALSRDHLEEYRLHLFTRKVRGRGLARGYQCTMLAAVKTFVRFLVKDTYLRYDVGAEMELPVVPAWVPKNVLTEAETRQLLEGVDLRAPAGVRDRAMLEMLYSTALRNAELINLRLEDLDLGRRLVRVARAKGGKSRMVPMGEEAAAWLGKYLERVRPALCREAQETRVFLSTRGRPFGRRVLAQLVHARARASGLTKRVTPHLLRHSCATHMLRRGAGLRQLQSFLGHASAEATQRYTHVEVSDLRRTLVRYHPRERPPT